MTESRPESQAWEGPELDNVVGAVGGRVQEVLDAAERAAESVLEDAETQAKDHLDDARRRADRITLERVELISELTDGLIEQGNAIRGCSQALIDALEEAVRRLGLETAAPVGQASGAPHGGHLSGEPSSLEALRESVESRTQSRQQPRTSEDPAERRRAAPGKGSEGARLLATQMAVAGSSREEIERRLRDEFGIEDPAAILEA